MQVGAFLLFLGYCYAVRFPGMHTNIKTLKTMPAVNKNKNKNKNKNRKYLVAVKYFLRLLWNE